eukprot:s2620_g20.t1
MLRHSQACKNALLLYASFMLLFDVELCKPEDYIAASSISALTAAELANIRSKVAAKASAATRASVEGPTKAENEESEKEEAAEKEDAAEKEEAAADDSDEDGQDSPKQASRQAKNQQGGPFECSPFSMEKYSFVQRLGQGAFAVVWKARRKSDGRLVAVKQLKQSPESWEACKQLPEVRAAAAISDRRHLVQLLEAVRHGGELFLVFEYIEGSLHHCIAAARRVEESQALASRTNSSDRQEMQVRWAARRLLMALAAVHAAGLVHCDVKPENILVGGSEGGGRGAPTMKLCDFGQSGPPGEIATYVGPASLDCS